MLKIRTDAALDHFEETVPRQRNNGDEKRYRDKRANFFKCLPQNQLGEVARSAYADFLRALHSGDPADFDAIPLSNIAERGLVNPQAAYAFDLLSRDSHATVMTPAPRFDGAEIVAEMGEVYWQALTRDIAFADYTWDDDIAAAADDLDGFSAIQAPTEGGRITPNTLFRAGLPGDLSGPYLSQFLWHDVPYGASNIEQRYKVPVAGQDFMLEHDEWLAIQRGALPKTSITFDQTPRYIHNGRALGEYVHKDAVFQAYLNAALIIQAFGPDAQDPDMPYPSATQDGFATFGAAHLFDMVTQAARLGLEAAWFHKWLVHRRLRAEVFAGRLEHQRGGRKDYGIDPEILTSEAADRMMSRFGSLLLPQSYPEGSPAHPSYPAGHSTVGGACATVLKAFVNEAFTIPGPVQATADGLDLTPWTGADLSLGHEIDKLAGNISIGRCIAGVHYRSDGRGMALGQAMAIGMLQDYSRTYNEDFDGFTLTSFEGARIRIVDGNIESA
jgi:membrane-associated phospholipid phosphatase